ncbi:uncharacterized protein LOC122650685 [Telopea speciosissima]|uniref:uncharacterized protein LOC122650685 n=1 Tax=Telopea speciosissima TaxID=54955 RepID=UPI001CC3F88D|nr:uncharacterized protein LOC122650685 [Telopea speciosissima]
MCTHDIDVWTVIEESPFVITKEAGEKIIPKKKSKWTPADKTHIQQYFKAIAFFQCALSEKEFNRTSMCSTVKELFDTLVVTYEGTSQAKQLKIDKLIYEYELFKMLDDESISDMLTRFTNTVNKLKSLGKEYSKAENIRKILRSLS